MNISLYISLILSHSTTIEPIQAIDIITDDPKDNMILECAVGGKADYIVSGDRHLLSLKEYKGIKILTAREFIELVSK